MFFGRQVNGVDTMWRVFAYTLTAAAGVLMALLLAVMTVPLVQGSDYWSQRNGHAATAPARLGEVDYWDLRHSEGRTVTEDSRYMRELAKKPYWVPAAKPSEQYPYPQLQSHYHNRRICYVRH